jgi:hypothetical protein
VQLTLLIPLSSIRMCPHPNSRQACTELLSCPQNFNWGRGSEHPQFPNELARSDPRNPIQVLKPLTTSIAQPMRYKATFLAGQDFNRPRNIVVDLPHPKPPAQ